MRPKVTKSHTSENFDKNNSIAESQRTTKTIDHVKLDYKFKTINSIAERQRTTKTYLTKDQVSSQMTKSQTIEPKIVRNTQISGSLNLQIVINSNL